MSLRGPPPFYYQLMCSLGGGGGRLLRTKIGGALGCETGLPNPLEQALLGSGWLQGPAGLPSEANCWARSSMESSECAWGPPQPGSERGHELRSKRPPAAWTLHSRVRARWWDGGGLTAEALRSRDPGFPGAKSAKPVAGRFLSVLQTGSRPRLVPSAAEPRGRGAPGPLRGPQRPRRRGKP